jgi:predicted nucleic acid-binding protein
VVLDAKVLVNAQVRDIFLSLAEREFIEFWWSEQILGEMRTVIVQRLGRDAPQVDRLCDAIRRAFPTGEVVVTDAVVEGLTAPDPDDVHVLTAAVIAEADLLVTYDRKGFPHDDTLEQWDLAVMSPDEAVQELVASFGAATVAEVFRDLTARLGNPAVGVEAQLERLEQVAPVSSVLLGNALDIDKYRNLANDIVAASAPDNPRAAVTDLLDRVAAGDAAGVDQLLSPDLRSAMPRTRRARLRWLSGTFNDALSDRDNWGFGTAHRPEGVDTEMVVLARSEARIFQQPTLVRAHRFRVVRDGDRWLIAGIDEPDPRVAAMIEVDPPAQGT